MAVVEANGAEDLGASDGEGLRHLARDSYWGLGK